MGQKNAKKDNSDVLNDILTINDSGTESRAFIKDPQNQKVQNQFDEAFKELDFDLGQSSKIHDQNREFEAEIEAPVLSLDASREHPISVDNSLSIVDLNTSSDQSFGLDLGEGFDIESSAIDKSESTGKTEIMTSKDLGLLIVNKNKDPEIILKKEEHFVDEEDSKTRIFESSLSDLESKKSIEATLHDIVRPDLNQELSIESKFDSELEMTDSTFKNTDEDSDKTRIDTSKAADNVFDFGRATNESSISKFEKSLNFDFNEMSEVNQIDEDEKTRVFNPQESNDVNNFNFDNFENNNSVNSGENTEDLSAIFNLENNSVSDDDLFNDGEDKTKIFNPNEKTPFEFKDTSHLGNEDEIEFADSPEDIEVSDFPTYNHKKGGKEFSSGMGEGEQVRFQSTIRLLREEREQLLREIKELKNEIKDYHQDNLSLKAALDEAKIEVSITRKRNTTDLEDLKFQLGMVEEKKNLAEERCRQLGKIKERLEQKARIDIGQIRQREKELESKLELLVMDSESQIQTRDQKILELRRKIDSLEFNMENASIKEQKSTEDKRKVEEKLNSIMKTLRNSIKNLENDIEINAELSKKSDKEK